MPEYRCELCGSSFYQVTGRPARKCKPCRSPRDLRYDARHRKFREDNVDDWVGSECVRCGRAMRDPATMDLDHDERGGYLGFSHSSCNRAAGAVKKNTAGRAVLLKMTSYDWGAPVAAVEVDVSGLKSRVLARVPVGERAAAEAAEVPDPVPGRNVLRWCRRRWVWSGNSRCWGVDCTNGCPELEG